MRISVEAAARERGYFALRVRDGDAIVERLVPAAGPLSTLARVVRDDLTLEIYPSEGRFERLGFVDWSIAKARLALGTLEGARLDFG